VTLGLQRAISPDGRWLCATADFHDHDTYGVFLVDLAALPARVSVPSKTIGDWTFYGCANLPNATITNGVIIIKYTGSGGSVVIPDTLAGLPVTKIGDSAFSSCRNLTNVTIPNTITIIADTAFRNCWKLAGVYFKGNAPFLHGTASSYLESHATVYYLSGTTGWGKTFDGCRTAPWDPKIQSNTTSGVRLN
jgi:hypothetical protein